MPAWRKLALGPAAKTACRRCGLAVGVAPLPALASLLPCAAVVLAVSAGWLTRPVTMILCALAAVALTSLAHLALVPLVPRQLTDAKAVQAAHSAAQSAAHSAAPGS